MKFQSLYKLFAIDESKSKETYLSRFNSEAALKFFVDINEYPSFFFFHNEINSLVYKIRDLDYRVNELFGSLPKVAQFQYIKKSLIDEIHFSNSIEGIVSTRKEISEILEDIESKNNKNKRFKGIINRYYMLLSDNNIKLESSIDVRKIYDEILLEEIKREDPNNVPDGEIFRKDVVNVSTSSGKVIHNGIMPESKIIQCIDKSLSLLNDENIEPMIRIAIFHYLFSYIHPFYDGNGRINRFIASYMFSKHYTKIISYRLSMTIKENLTSYYDAFKITNDIRNKGDITTFVYEFLNIVYKAYEKTEMYALSKKSELESYLSRIDKLKLSKNNNSVLQILLQAELFSEHGVTVLDLVNNLGLSDSTCRKVLDYLIENNYATEKYIGKKKYYSANLEKLND
ncbi:MAG: Fic family protein [Erysipelotrichaceae bacterium]|nr:Fic family protein [Erysipelotrichaceae bacterium]